MRYQQQLWQPEQAKQYEFHVETQTALGEGIVCGMWKLVGKYDTMSESRQACRMIGQRIRVLNKMAREYVWMEIYDPDHMEENIKHWDKFLRGKYNGRLWS